MEEKKVMSAEELIAEQSHEILMNLNRGRIPVDEAQELFLSLFRVNQNQILDEAIEKIKERELRYKRLADQETKAGNSFPSGLYIGKKEECRESIEILTQLKNE